MSLLFNKLHRLLELFEDLLLSVILKDLFSGVYSKICGLNAYIDFY